jgi:hypothetical protein
VDVRHRLESLSPGAPLSTVRLLEYPISSRIGFETCCVSAGEIGSRCAVIDCLEVAPDERVTDFQVVIEGHRRLLGGQRSALQRGGRDLDREGIPVDAVETAPGDPPPHLVHAAVRRHGLETRSSRRVFGGNDLARQVLERARQEVAGPHRGIEYRAVERALGDSVRPVAIGVGESVVTVGIDGGELRPDLLEERSNRLLDDVFDDVLRGVVRPRRLPLVAVRGQRHLAGRDRDGVAVACRNVFAVRERQRFVGDREPVLEQPLVDIAEAAAVEPASR